MLNNLSTFQKILVTIVIVIILYVGSTAASYWVFSNYYSDIISNIASVPEQITGNKNSTEIEYEACPLNGKFYPKEQRAKWETHRPLGIMVENSTDARPQSGLSSADIIYEAVAEGGITRFLTLYYCNTDDVTVGPVRSARTYFLDWISEYDGLYAHVGGANTPGPANALGQIIDYKIKALNQFNIGYPTFWRDYERLGRAVATEHTVYASTTKLWEVAASRNWGFTDASGISWNARFIPWKFVESSKVETTASNIEVNFWESQTAYQVIWKFDSSCGCYKRTNGGLSHIDNNTKDQLSPKNVVVQFMRESRANDGYPGNAHLLYQNKGSGRATFFIDGKVIDGKWSKLDRTSRTKYTDSLGKEIEFIRGQIWIQTVPEGADINYNSNI